MKFHNPTQRKEHFRRPKRYEFRYLYDPTDDQSRKEHQQRRQLYGIRELGGYVVHRTVAELVRSLADGQGHGDYASAGQRCRAEFLDIMAHSCAVGPGVFIGGPQLAETFNGALDEEFGDQIRYWRDAIPAMVENAGRAILTLGIKSSSSDHTVEAEKSLSWMIGTTRYRYVLDVLTRSKYQTVVVDFKCHSIDSEDICQVRNYLQFLHEREGIPESRLYGFAVDLRNEEIVPVKYNPFAVSKRKSTSLKSSAFVRKSEIFLAKPHPQLCGRCPYATLCPESCLATEPALFV